MEKKVYEEVRRFNYMTAEIDEAYHEAALKLGLSDSAMRILYTVCHGEGACQLNDIIRLSGISKQTVNSALRKLESEELVYLKTSGGRKKMVCLTGKGTVFVKSTVLRIIEIENDIFGSWTETERTVYLELTGKYLSHFRESIKELQT